MPDIVDYPGIGFRVGRTEAFQEAEHPSLECKIKGELTLAHASLNLEAGREVRFGIGANDPKLTSSGGGIQIHAPDGLTTRGNLNVTGMLSVARRVEIGNSGPDERTDSLVVLGAVQLVGSQIYFSGDKVNLYLQPSNAPPSILNLTGRPGEGRLDYAALWIRGRGVDAGRLVAVEEHLRVEGDLNVIGNVGVGTTSPGFRLDVADRMRVRSGGNTAGIWFYDSGPKTDQAFVGMAGPDQVGLYGNTGARWALQMGTTTGHVYLKKSLRIGERGAAGVTVHPPPGTDPLEPGQALEVNGSVTVKRGDVTVDGDVSASNFPTPSDIRLKTRIEPLTEVLEKVQQIRAVRYSWRERPTTSSQSTRETEIGVLAQEVEAVFPELVTEDGRSGLKCLDYGRLSAILVQAVHELREENRRLANRVLTLEGASAPRVDG